MSAAATRGQRQRAEAVAAAGQGATVAALEALLFRHDPIGLDLGSNPDEYRPEAETIALRRAEVRSLQDAQRVTHEVFVEWFDADTAGPPERYAEVAREVWNLLQQPHGGERRERQG